MPRRPARKPYRRIRRSYHAAEGTRPDLLPEEDAVVCLEVPRPFVAVGQSFVEFGAVPDEVAIAALESTSAGE